MLSHLQKSMSIFFVTFSHVLLTYISTSKKLQASSKVSPQRIHVSASHTAGKAELPITHS